MKNVRPLHELKQTDKSLSKAIKDNREKMSIAQKSIQEAKSFTEGEQAEMDYNHFARLVNLLTAIQAGNY